VREPPPLSMTRFSWREWTSALMSERQMVLQAPVTNDRAMQPESKHIQHPERSGAGASWWLPELDGLRAVACLAVVIHHAAGRRFEGIALANLGVALFFCISGFLIFVLAAREQSLHGAISLKRFYRRRILRIWPLYFTVLALGILVSFLWTGPGIAYLYAIAFVLNLGMAFNYAGAHYIEVPDFLMVTWSIAVEEQFYAVFPFLFSFFRRPGISVVRMVLLTLLISLLARTVFVSVPLEHPDPASIGNQAGLYYSTMSYVDLFLLGAVAGAVYLRRGVVGIESSRAMTTLFVAAIAACGVLALWWEPALWPPYVWYSPLIYTLIAIVMSCLVYAIVANPAAPYSRLLRLYPLRVFGLLSYGIYLVHVPAIHIVKIRFPGLAAADVEVAPFAVGVAYAMVLAVAMAAALYALIERPFLQLKGRRAMPTGRLTSVTVPWRRCMLLALGVIVAIEAVSGGLPPTW
jgi:peptidoglycan/LPS O-acetylase OafA/YrhL